MISNLGLRDATATSLWEYFFSRNPVKKLPNVGTRIKRTIDGEMPKSRYVVPLIARVKSTAINPASTPITMVRIRKIWSSRKRRRSRSGSSEILIEYPRGGDQSTTDFVHVACFTPGSSRFDPVNESQRSAQQTRIIRKLRGPEFRTDAHGLCLEGRQAFVSGRMARTLV